VLYAKVSAFPRKLTFENHAPTGEDAKSSAVAATPIFQTLGVYCCKGGSAVKGARKSRVGSGRPARGVDRLHPAMQSRMWKPGQSGNPTGRSGEYGSAIKLAQRAAPKAVRRLIELMDSADERVVAVACNAILDRAFGKPKAVGEEKDDLEARVKAMTPEERLARAEEIIEKGKKYLPAFEALMRKREARRLRLVSGAAEERGDGDG
jgi:hypothetical protein